MAINLVSLAVCARMEEPVSIRNVALQTLFNDWNLTGPAMSKQLTLSATIAVLSMAALALSTSMGGYGKAESGARTVSAPLIEMSVAD